MSTLVADHAPSAETREKIAKKPELPIKSGPIYRDIREYLAELDRRGLLIKVKRLMNKDTEVMPLVRWQFRGLDQSQRKGWLFENLTDSRGRKFDGSVAVGIAGSSPQVYAAAMGLESPKGVAAKWLSAMTNPIQPVEVARDQAPVKEVVITGEDIVKSSGIDLFPVTVTNPGTDVSAYFSAPIWITRDPETDVYNVGTYRVMVKAALRQHHTTERHHVLAAHGLADYRKCILPDLALRRDVVGAVQIPLVDLRARNERVDLDGVVALDGNGVEFVIIHRDVGVLRVFVAAALVLTLDGLARDLVDQPLA